jgi:hypothetical protein
MQPDTDLLDALQTDLAELTAVLATWDIRSNTCAMTMSFTHIFFSLST